MSHTALLVSVRMAKEFTRNRLTQGWSKGQVAAHAKMWRDARVANGCEAEVANAIQRAFTDGL